MRLIEPGLDARILQRPAHGEVLTRLKAIAGICSAIEPDLLVTYNWGAIEWAIVNRLRFNRPHVHLEDGFGPEEADRQKIRRVLTRRFFLTRSKIIVPSHNLERIARALWKIEPNDIVYIPNGIDATRFDGIPTNGMPFFSRQNNECVIGSFSPLRREKNLARLIRAFALLPALPNPVRLVICGHGPERDALSSLSNELGVLDRVTFSGDVPFPELVMGAFDIFAMTSDTEQMPYAVLEAMSARLPVVATAVGDISKMVAEENRSFVVERDSLGCLVYALEHLCRNATLRQHLGRANRSKVETDFQVARMVEAFRGVFMDVL